MMVGSPAGYRRPRIAVMMRCAAGFLLETIAMSRSLATLVLLVLSGCGQRPVESILASADFRFEHGDYAEARQEYAEATTRQPGRWWAHYRLGLCLIELDRPGDARLALEIAHTQNARQPRIVEALAEAMLQQGDNVELFAFLKQEAETAQTVDAYLRLARYADLLGDPDSARAALDTAIVIDDGRTVEPYLEAAAFSQRLGDMDEAVRRLSQAYFINPRDRRVSEQLRELGEVPGPTISVPPGK